VNSAGRHSFGRKSLHAINGNPNPYEQAISIIGRTLSPFDDDNLIPCFGFGDASTHDHSVFSFFQDSRPCRGFEEVLVRYRQIVPHLNLSGNKAILVGSLMIHCWQSCYFLWSIIGSTGLCLCVAYSLVQLVCRTNFFCTSDLCSDFCCWK